MIAQTHCNKTAGPLSIKEEGWRLYRMKEVSRDLVSGCVKGDRRSHTEMYALVYPTLMSMSKRYFVNNDDRTIMLNNCFLKLIKSLSNYKFESAFEAWCRRLMTNTIIDEYRKNKRWKETIQLSENLTDNETQFTLNETDEKYSAEKLEGMLLSLPLATRCVFNLFALEGYAHSEISKMLSISEGTSKWHVSKAREDLKKMLHDIQFISK